MYKICFYVPESHLDLVKEAVFATGAGRIGNYDQCCWQSKGQGQFRPLPGSNPFIGKSSTEGSSKVEFVDEYKVEMVCENALITNAVAALRKSHPYEEPAFDLWELSQL